MRARLAVIAFILFALAGAVGATPNAMIYNYNPALPLLTLVSLLPNDLQTLNATPSVVTATFSLAIDPTRSNLKMFDPYNNPVGGTHGSPKDTVLTFQPQGHLLSGIYRIEWNATCSCKGNPGINGVTQGLNTAVSGVSVGSGAAVSTINSGSAPDGNPTISGTAHFTIQ